MVSDLVILVVGTCKRLLLTPCLLFISLRYWDPYYYRRRRVQTERVQTDDNKMNFVESVCDGFNHSFSIVSLLVLYLKKKVLIL